jgi:hypothetical protein
MRLLNGLSWLVYKFRISLKEAVGGMRMTIILFIFLANRFTANISIKREIEVP